MPATAGLVVSQTWQYKGQMEKMTIPIELAISYLKI